MGKFAMLINQSGDATIQKRSARIVKSAKNAYDKILLNLEAEVTEIEDEIELLLDQNPDNRYSLQPGKSFKAVEWSDEYQSKSVLLANKKIELQIARANVAELFDDETEISAESPS